MTNSELNLNPISPWLATLDSIKIVIFFTTEHFSSVPEEVYFETFRIMKHQISEIREQQWEKIGH